MRTAVVRTLLGFAGAALMVVACQTEPQVPDDVGAELRKLKENRVTKPLEPPADIAGLAEVGVPVYPGSFLSDKPDAIKVTEDSLREVVSVKYYSPANVEAVQKHTINGIRDASQVGGADMVRVKGRTKFGHAIEVWIGPAADKKQSLVMAWVTEEKNMPPSAK